MYPYLQLRAATEWGREGMPNSKGLEVRELTDYLIHPFYFVHVAKMGGEGLAEEPTAC